MSKIDHDSYMTSQRCHTLHVQASPFWFVRREAFVDSESVAIAIL